MKKQRKNSHIITISVLAMFGVGMVASFVGLSNAVTNIDEEVIARKPEAILASAGVENGANIDLPVTYYDQKQDACVNMYDNNTRKALLTRQFEWSKCDYSHKQLEQGLVAHELDKNYFPVMKAGNLLPNRGLNDGSRWFSSVENKSKEYSGTLKLSYETSNGPTFSYAEDNFYPLDEVKFSAGDAVNNDGHNRLFTMNFAVPFVVTTNGDEYFEITADDDTFVFVGSELVIDMGGIHEASVGKMIIHENGEIYTAINDEEFAFSGVNVKKDDGSIVRIFHADRDSADSVFKIVLKNMNLNIVQTQMAGTDGVQVAYDPTNPEYVAPLGESQIFRPNGTKGHMITVIILGVAVVVCAIFMVILSHSLIKNKRR